MSLLIHNTIRKYTLALLETFNGIKVEYPVTNTNGTPEYKYKNVPIRYSTREKLNLLDEVDEQNLLSGNYNILPRTSLALSTITRNSERQSNKFNKIATTDFGEFVFNAVSYDFAYDMTIMCRGMNEASMIIEEIAARFNPNYTLLINEIPNQVKPTSVPLQILDISIEASDYDELSTDIITVNVGMNLKGNFYRPISNMEKIKNVDMYMNFWYQSTANDYNRAKLYKYDVTEGVLQPKPEEFSLVNTEGEFGKIPPVIVDIECNDGTVDEEIPIVCKWIDNDNKYDELSFIWNVSGNAEIIGTGDKVVLIGRSTETVEIRCAILDIHNNTSNIFIKQVTIV
jgi:hypothetical protein